MSGIRGSGPWTEAMQSFAAAKVFYGRTKETLDDPDLGEKLKIGIPAFLGAVGCAAGVAIFAGSGGFETTEKPKDEVNVDPAVCESYQDSLQVGFTQALARAGMKVAFPYADRNGLRAEVDGAQLVFSGGFDPDQNSYLVTLTADVRGAGIATQKVGVHFSNPRLNPQVHETWNPEEWNTVLRDVVIDEATELTGVFITSESITPPGTSDAYNASGARIDVTGDQATCVIAAEPNVLNPKSYTTEKPTIAEAADLEVRVIAAILGRRQNVAP